MFVALLRLRRALPHAVLHEHEPSHVARWIGLELDHSANRFDRKARWRLRGQCERWLTSGLKQEFVVLARNRNGESWNERVLPNEPLELGMRRGAADSRRTGSTTAASCGSAKESISSESLA